MPCVAEVIGPPGAGKSTLLAGLAAADPTLRTISRYRGARHIPSYVYSASAVGRVVPRGFLPGGDHRQRARWMMRLEASAGILEATSARAAGPVLFDQGPAYTLARLAGARVPSTDGPRYVRWRDRKVEQWAAIYSVLVVLDAPDDLLIERIMAREKPHPIESLGRRAAHAELARQRAGITATLSEIAGRAGPPCVRVDTGGTSLPDLVDLVADVLAQRPGRRPAA